MVGLKMKDKVESCGTTTSVVASPTHENPRLSRMKIDFCGAILQRLHELNCEEATLPDFEDKLWQHFNRLPSRYALDYNVERAEDVLRHQKLLKLAEDPEARPAFEVRIAHVVPRNSSDSVTGLEEADQRFKHLSMQGVPAPPTFGSSSSYETAVEEDVTTRHIHEITVSTIDKPKLLNQLLNLLDELGLNILEAHAFTTADGFSLDVVVVDGWYQEEVDSLKDAVSKELLKVKEAEGIDPLNKEIQKLKDQQADLKQKSIALPNHFKIPNDVTDEWEIDLEHLQIGNKVGTCSYGYLHRGTYCSQEVAIKIINPENTEMLREFSQEVYILRKIRHVNVVQFLGASTRSPNFCIVTEFMERGSIYDILQKQKSGFTLETMLKVALDAARGMRCLHESNIIHRDLKSANILMNEFGRAKITGFGVESESESYNKWMAPEVIEQRHYNHKADVYSYGIVLWELLTGQIPFGDMNPLEGPASAISGNRPEIPEETHPKVRELVERCWHQEADQRPVFVEIVGILEEIIKEVNM